MNTALHCDAVLHFVSAVLFNKLSVTPNLSKYELSGDDGTRTHDLRLAKALLSQLSYIPRFAGSVGLTGFEPVTPALSAQCSNQLSYRPDGLLYP